MIHKTEREIVGEPVIHRTERVTMGEVVLHKMENYLQETCATKD